MQDKPAKQKGHVRHNFWMCFLRTWCAKVRFVLTRVWMFFFLEQIHADYLSTPLHRCLELRLKLERIEHALPLQAFQCFSATCRVLPKKAECLFAEGQYFSPVRRATSFFIRLTTRAKRCRQENCSSRSG